MIRTTPHRPRALACVLLGLLAACGAPKNETRGRDPDGDTISEGIGERAWAVIGSQGGTVTLRRGAGRGAKIVIPPGALISPTEITMEVAKARHDLPWYVRSAGPFIDFGPDGLVFLRPVTVTLPVTRGASANSVYQSSHPGQWERVPGAHLNLTVGRMY